MATKPSAKERAAATVAEASKGQGRPRTAAKPTNKRRYARSITMSSAMWDRLDAIEKDTRTRVCRFIEDALSRILPPLPA